MDSLADVLDGDLVSDEEFARARAEGEAQLLLPRAERAWYDAERRMIVVRLRWGIEVAVSPDDLQGFQGATAAQLQEIEILPFGLGVHWPVINADFYVPSLCKGILGSARWMEARAARGLPVPGQAD